MSFASSATTRRYLYVMDPWSTVHPAKDTTFDFMLETQGRGIENWVCTIHELFADGAKGFAHCRQATVRRPTVDDASYYREEATQIHSFDDFTVIWMRKDPPVDDAFLLSCMLLDRADPSKTLVLNNPSSLRVANEKLWALFADELIARTVVGSKTDFLLSVARSMEKAVLKPINFAGGAGVLVFDGQDRNLKSAIDLLTHEGKRPCIVQEYLPKARHGDKRVILLGGEPIGAVLRVPAGDDHRANMHVGGAAAKAEIDENDRKIAARLKPHLLSLDLHFVGIDVIGGKLSEVNVTSPTGVQEIDVLDGRTGKDRMSAQVMDYVDDLLRKKGLLSA